MPAQVSDWYTRLSEPVRLKSRIPAFSYYFARPSYFGGPDPHIIGWFRHLTEPVRQKPPLTAARIPHYFAFYPLVDYRLAVTETGDSLAMTVNVYVPKKLARTAISEIQAYPARVTIREIKYTRGYS